LLELDLRLHMGKVLFMSCAQVVDDAHPCPIAEKPVDM
jgi:hypothetical protein